MFPGIYGFVWDTGHIVFLGVFYAVVAVMAATVTLAVRNAAHESGPVGVTSLRWRADFEDLPASARRCRHELRGEVARRTCANGFDCRTCVEHARLGVGSPAPSVALAGAEAPPAAGFDLPADRLYHRGHTWVRAADDGTLTVGLDDLGARLVGEVDVLDLPAPGTRLVANGTAWRMRRNGVSTRVLAPVDGEVVSVGGPGEQWYLRLRPSGAAADLRHLLTAAEARPWMLRELERLQLSLAEEEVGAALADGGLPAADFGAALSADELAEACGAVFLEP